MPKCHDPHNSELGDSLRIFDRMAAICVTCHDMTGWLSAAHATSNKRTTGRTVDPRERLKYATVSDNGCLNCHKIHSARGRERLLRFQREEDNCLNCHGDMGKPRHLAVGPDGVIFIADVEFGHVHLFDYRGRLLTLLGGHEDKPGGTPMPVSVAVASLLPDLVAAPVPADFQPACFLFVTSSTGTRRISRFAVGSPR